MKKVLLLLGLAGLFVVVLGCGPSDVPSKAKDKPPSTKPEMPPPPPPPIDPKKKDR